MGAIKRTNTEDKMEELKGTSLDLTQYNIDKLKEIFPEVFCEDKIDFDKLRLVLGDNVEDREERYEFNWHGKRDAIRIAQTPSTGTLRPDKEGSRNWDTTENLYIEGDNLEVLKLLQKSYFSKIKMIYIDPPYNTGKDFVYKDNFRDNIANYKEITSQETRANPETNGRYHTDWLNMMYPRLKLARNLLKEDGIIFISIDDNELVNLKKICDEIFGEENIIAQLVWDLGAGTQAGHFTRAHEYILVYGKNKNVLENFSGGNGIIEDRAVKKISSKNPSSNFTFKAGTKFNSTCNKELQGEWGGSEKIKLISGRMICEDGKLKEDVVLNAGWAMKNQMTSWFDGQETFDSKGQKVIDFFFNENGILRYKKIRSIVNPPTIIKDKGSTKQGTNELQEILGDLSDGFQYPKPNQLIKFIINLALDKDEIVLDFFSGSTTTANAILDLNSEKNKNIKYIMVQLPELLEENTVAYQSGYKNICDIGKERLKRAGNKILEENKDKEGIENVDIGFKVFKLDSSNLKSWDSDLDNLEKNFLDMESNLKNNRTNEDLLYEILLKSGVELTSKIEKIKVGYNTIYNIGYGSLLACLDDSITQDVIDEIPKHKSEFEKEMNTKVIFKEAGFASDAAKINAVQNLKQFGIKDVRSV